MKKIKTVPVNKIVDQYQELRTLVEKYSEDKEQLQAVNKMLDDFEHQITGAPASGRLNYHNCFVGGFIDHVLRVQETAFKVKQLLLTMDINVSCSDSEIFFAAIFHDWGKLGTLEDPYYVKQDSSWHQEKLGEYWKHNTDMDYMSVTDRALYTLQAYGIKVSNEVWKAIKLSDGMFEDGNASYLKRPSESDNILYYIIHWADWMSTVVEKQHYVQGYDDAPIEKNEERDKLKAQFAELFPE
tara:strand:+ start:3122 stop:3844 length:723 start_codon:yes stop_codon:yes gene_type:complete